MGHRIGPVQKAVLAYLRRRGGESYIGALTLASELEEIELIKIDDAIERLRARGLVRKVGYRRYRLHERTEE